LLAGQLSLVLQPVVTSLSHVKRGKLRILAIMLPNRWEELPDVPTVQEVVKGFEKAPGGIGIWGPAGLPQNLATRLQTAIAAGLHAPEVAEKLKAQGMVPIGNSPAQFANEIASGMESNDKLVKASGVRPL
jgi:tripartite-type tricarboxylate transporter receptor subunit TctC